MKIIRGTVNVEKLITKAEFARRQELTRSRITQLAETDSLPAEAKLVKIHGGELVLLK